MDHLSSYVDLDLRTVNVAASFARGEWIAWARMVPPTFDVVELRVFPMPVTTIGDKQVPHLPDEHALNQGYAPHIEGGVPPWGSVPFRQLRDVHVRELQQWGREALEKSGPWLEEHGYDTKAWQKMAGIKPARRPKLSTDQRLVVLANEYLDLLEAGEDTPNEVLADRYGRTPGWVATELHRARTRGLLTKPPRQGKPGGKLTPEGKDILRTLLEPKDKP